MKKLLFPLISSLLVLYLISISSISHAQKWGKYIGKAEDKYEDGDYKKALKQLDKLKKKSLSKLGNPNKYLAFAFIKEAKNYWAMGHVYNLDQLIANSLLVSERANGVESTDHALILLEAADIYIHYGNFKTAEEYLDKAESILKKLDRYNDDFNARITLGRAEILHGKGFYSKAGELIESQEEYYKNRAVDEVTYVDKESAKIKTRKLSKDEVLRRYRDYVNLMTLKAKNLSKKGDWKPADAIFHQTDNWTDKYLGKKDLASIENTLEWARMLRDHGNEELYVKYLDHARSKLRGKYKPYHYLNIEVQQDLIRGLQQIGKTGKMKAERVNYDKSTRKYFGQKSMHWYQRQILDLDIRLSADKTRTIIPKALNLLNETTVFPKIHPDRIQLLEFLSTAAAATNDYHSAEKYLLQILEIKEKLYGKQSPEYALSEVKLANYYISYMDKIKEAEKIYEESYESILKDEITIEHVDYVDIQKHLAELYQITDRYDLASKTLGHALTAIQTKYDNQDPDYAIALDQIADLQISIGEYENAAKNNETAQKILRDDNKKSTDYAETLVTSAKIMAIKGMFDEAESALGKSRKIMGRSRLLDRMEASGDSEVELASLLIDIGEYSQTEKVIQETIKNYQKAFGPESRKLIRPLTEFSRLRLITGDYTDAEKLARRAFDISKKIYGENSSKTAEAQSQLARVYTVIGDYEKAEENITKTISVYEKQFGKEHVDVAKAISQLALIKYFKKGDNREIEQLFTRAKNIVFSKLGASSPLYGEALKNLAIVYIRMDRNQEALALLSQAEKLWVQKLGRRNNVNLASIYTIEGDLYYKEHQYEKSEDKYKDARKLYDRAFSKNHPDYVKVLSKLSKVAYMQDNLKKSKRLIDEALSNYRQFIQIYFPALSEREKAKFWNTIKPDFEFYNTLAVRLYHSDNSVLEEMYNNALISKALLLNSSIKIRERIINSGDQELISKFADWNRKKEVMTSALSMSEEELIEAGIDLNALKSEVELLEKELSEKSELFGQSFEEKKITWENVKNSLKANEVAIEMIRFRYFDHTFTDSVMYALMHVKLNNKRRPELILLRDGKHLEHKFLNYYRNSIKYKLKDVYSYERFWEPISREVGNFSTIYLSPDGVYNQINLEAIPVGDGKYVLDNSNIILLSNTKDIYFKRQKEAMEEQADKNAAIMFGNPDFYLTASTETNRAITDLPGTQKEIEELHNLLSSRGWSTEDYVRKEASEEKVKELDNPRVFHVATHGFFTSNDDIGEGIAEIEISEVRAIQNPLLRTGLLLTGAGDLLNRTTYNYNIENGILTAYEAMNLNLDYTDLVVLSACETGLGDVQIGEGVFGLQRAFLVAGAETLIMSLFKVSDEATQELMVNFYKKWLETGNKRESFVASKKEIRSKYPEPIYWGAFIMMGID